jgi:hypothetical protein
MKPCITSMVKDELHRQGDVDRKQVRARSAVEALRSLGFPLVFSRPDVFGRLPWPDIALLDLLRSGIAFADPLDMQAIAPRYRSAVYPWIAANGPALVASLRSARTGSVEGTILHCLSGEERFVPNTALLDPDGSPRAFGMAGAAVGADLLLLGVGVVDTLAMEALLVDFPGVVSVGAANTDEVTTWAEFLTAEKFTGEVVVVPPRSTPTPRWRPSPPCAPPASRPGCFRGRPFSVCSGAQDSLMARGTWRTC